MRTIIIAVACLTLAACNAVTNISAGISAADNALARLSQNQIAPACSIIAVAAGYFEALAPSIGAANQRRYAQARAIIDPICASPPANIGGALVTLNKAWFEFQNATKSQ